MSIPNLPLELAEHHMLQVLLPSLTLEKLDQRDTRGSAGVNLTVEFSDATQAMWRRQQRVLVRDSIHDFAARAARIDGDLAAFLADAKASERTFAEPPFVFRYGNGGTLPILKLGDREYYCLAYRDIAPIGWNLANGASDTRHELLNPLTTIHRELREELLVVNEKRRIRYVLQRDDEDALDRPEFILAREFWKRKRGTDIGLFEERMAPVTWIHGPDSVTVKCPGQPPRTTDGIFLNISAADFGIEADRIAKIHVDADAIVLDGEMYGSRLVDRPIGLFDIDRFAKTLLSGSEFIPDVLFLSGERIEGEPGKIVARHAEACAAGNRPLRSERENEEWERCQARFSLCPVTRQLAARHLAQEALVSRNDGLRSGGGRPYDVFISSTGHDADLAIAQSILSHFARDSAIGPVFFYKDAPMSMYWLSAIENALQSASSLIVVCTDIARVRRLHYEWSAFFVWTQYGEKNRQIVPVVHGVRPHQLPMPLCSCDSVDWVPGDAAPLDTLTRKVKAAAG